jgi:hypothetical protein
MPQFNAPIQRRASSRKVLKRDIEHAADTHVAAQRTFKMIQDPPIVTRLNRGWAMDTRDLSAELMSCEKAATSSPTVFNILNACGRRVLRGSARLLHPPKLMLDLLQAMQLAQLGRERVVKRVNEVYRRVTR